jgi:formamidopyrimidine-DNA glycosylase
LPELPELEIVKEVLSRRIAGTTISAAQVVPPGGAIVVRDLTRRGLVQTFAGSTIDQIARRGKFLILSTPSAHLAINPKLTSRLHLATAADKRFAKTHFVFMLSNGTELRYVDQKQMGQMYFVDELTQVAELGALGPEPLEISFADFQSRLKNFRGEIKGVLTRGEFVAGIGNAYADEILWAAQLHPYRKRTQLGPEEVKGLYQAMQETLRQSMAQVEKEMGEQIHLKPRDFLAVHMKTGEPCPRCGNPISLIGANQRITNFCRHCQPGGLIKGM